MDPYLSPQEDPTYLDTQGKNALGNPIKTYFVATVLSLIFCGGLLSIPALIFSLRVEYKLKRGDFHGALVASRYARFWMLAAISVMSCLYLCVFGFLIVMSILTILDI